MSGERERERESVEEVSALGSKYMWTNGQRVNKEPLRSLSRATVNQE